MCLTSFLWVMPSGKSAPRTAFTCGAPAILAAFVRAARLRLA